MRDIKRTLFSLLALILITQTSSFSQEGPRTYKILSISTEGNKFYDSRIIVSSSGLKIGDEIMIPSEATQAAIMNLWNMRLFSDVEITVDKSIGDVAYLVIKVKELPKLDNIKFSGNDEFNDKDLEEKIPGEKGKVVTAQTVKDME